MIDPIFLVALPVAAIGGVVALLWWRRQRAARPSVTEEALAVALAYALALVALHRAAAPLGVMDTPLLVATAAGGVAFLDGSFKSGSARWALRATLVALSVFVVLSGAIGGALYSAGGALRAVGYATLLLLVWGAGTTLLAERGGARPLLLALAAGAGVSALSTSAGPGEALLAGSAVGLVAVVAHLAAPPFDPPRRDGTCALVGALWVAALVGG